jgi:hypothetical protein
MDLMSERLGIDRGFYCRICSLAIGRDIWGATSGPDICAPSTELTTELLGRMASLPVTATT